jgi:aminoglycoside phosphotransferase (APT) family kinase protein
LVHRVDTAAGPFVLRRVPWRASSGDGASGDIRREATALGLLAGQPWVPRLVAGDPDGSACGMPASVQTLLPGRPDTGPRDLRGWIDGLAEAVRLMATTGAASIGLAPFEVWFAADSDPPGWASDTGAWRAALELFREAPAAEETAALCHRDLHPGNILFSRGRMAGMVDWVNACRGPAWVDLSRCRVEVAFLAGFDAADALAERCSAAVGGYDRRADAFTVLELATGMDGLLALNHFGSRLELHAVRATLDRLLVEAMTSA